MMDMFTVYKSCHIQELWVFHIFYELSKNEITGLNFSDKKLRIVWWYNSRVECLPFMDKVLNSILSTKEGNAGGEEGRSEGWRKGAEKNEDSNN